MDIELQDMGAQTIETMGCAVVYPDTNWMTNAWVAVVGTATWSWPGGAPTVTTVSNHISLTGWVSLDLQGGDAHSTGFGMAWVEGGTNGVAPYGWVRCLVNGTNDASSGTASIFGNRGSWNTGYPYNANNGVQCGYPSTCGGREVCTDELQVYGYFTLEYDTAVYQVAAGATSITVQLSADCETRAGVTNVVNGGGCEAYANADAEISNGSILAYLQN